MRIIALDDETDALLTLANHLIDLPNISISIYKDNWQEAINYAKKYSVDMAFLDINMPSINGIELAQKFIEINKNIKIVFITGFVHDMDLIKEKIGTHLFGFCYKPYTSESIKELIIKSLNDKQIYFKMFPRFDLIVNSIVIDFKSTKTKELLALLADHEGTTLTLEETISKLWPEKEPELAKRLYRDAVSRLRLILKELEIEYIINFNRARLSLDTTKISCDYYDYLNKLNNDYNGEYLRPYDWSIYTEQYLNVIKETREKANA